MKHLLAVLLLHLLVVTSTSCTRPDPCADVVCEQPGGNTCLDDRTAEQTPLRGTCDPATGACVPRPARRVPCGEGERCVAGACTCDPTTCTGCCGAGCMTGDTISSCGTAGQTCQLCGANATCEQHACTPCPVDHIRQGEKCVRDWSDVTVIVPPTATSTVRGDQVFIWDWSTEPTGRLTLEVPTGATFALGSTTLTLNVPLTGSMGRVRDVPLSYASGRSRVLAVAWIHIRAISEACRLTPAGDRLCLDGGLLDLPQPIVDLSRDCVLTTSGALRCDTPSRLESLDAGFIANLSLPCMRTAEGDVFCESNTGSRTWSPPGNWSQVECRGEFCAGLDEEERVWGWGNHPTLFGDAGRPPQLTAVQLPAFAGKAWRRIAPGVETFFALPNVGPWSDRVGDLTALGPDVNWVESTAGCQYAVASDGGLKVNLALVPDASSPIVDVFAGTERAHALGTGLEVYQVICNPAALELVRDF